MGHSARTAFFQELRARASDWNVSLQTLFETEPDRARVFRAEGAGVCLDFSKHWIDQPTWKWLSHQVSRLGFAEVQQDLISGGQLNYTEHRAALHLALRGQANDPFSLDGQPVMPEVLRERERCDRFADAIRSGAIRGQTGCVFTDVLNIGIGGSDLGPLMACQALEPFRQQGPKTHFVSNVDPAHLHSVISSLDPQKTLILVASKTFTTQETMLNAQRAKEWLLSTLGPAAVATHMVALSANPSAVRAFGIQVERMFPFWDWVGGRFSLWSAIGMALRCQIGSEQFAAFLAGARAMDQHFLEAPAERNLPVILALLGIWYRNGFDLRSHAVLPYSQRLARFPAYLQQLEMESNGKHIDHDGQTLPWGTAPVIWGDCGTNGQHAFHQWLHQGSDVIPVDFLLAREPVEGDPDAHALLVANGFAQTEALAFGEPHPNPHRKMPGNRPSTLIGIDRLDPRALGALIALYEHKTVTQGALWGINSFDQFGVELGKRLCHALIPALQDPTKQDLSSFSSSTRAWLDWFQKRQ